MSTRERAENIFSKLSEKQLETFIVLFSGSTGQDWDNIPEEEPDEWDKALIEDSRLDNDETVSFAELAEKLGVDPNDI